VFEVHLQRVRAVLHPAAASSSKLHTCKCVQRIVPQSRWKGMNKHMLILTLSEEVCTAAVRSMQSSPTLH
jgi:hypothetical protein